MNETKPNKNIRLFCVQCEKPFIFTEGEQKFYSDNLLIEPKRCPECRAIRKAEFNQRKIDGDK